MWVPFSRAVSILCPCPSVTLVKVESLAWLRLPITWIQTNFLQSHVTLNPEPVHMPATWTLCCCFPPRCHAIPGTQKNFHLFIEVQIKSYFSCFFFNYQIFCPSFEFTASLNIFPHLREYVPCSVSRKYRWTIVKTKSLLKKTLLAFDMCIYIYIFPVFSPAYWYAKAT